MASPDLELKGAIVAVLKADAAVVALVGTRIYDNIPANATFPYISFGPRDTVTADADCIVAFDITQQLDVWSRAVGSSEAERITDAVREALHEYEFNLSVNAAVFFEHRITRTLKDPDGLTTHAAMTFQGLIEKPLA